MKPTALFLALAASVVASAAPIASAAVTLPTFDVAKPDAVLVDGAADAAKRVKLLPCCSARRDVFVYVSGEEPISKVELVWNVPLPKDALVYCGDWERTYAKAGWYRMGDSAAPNGGWKPWYFLVNDGNRTDGYGLMVQPNVFGAWKVEPGRVTLSLDLRAGTRPLRLKGRILNACTLVSRRGAEKETPFAAAQEFCRRMCPKPRLPKSPVYGYNDWYCAYGKNSATNFLADAQVFVDCCKGLENRPYVVVDDGWQLANANTAPADGFWRDVRPKLGMPMDEVARRVRAMGAKPGLWYRPFLSWRAAGKMLAPGGDKGIPPLDPTCPELREKVKGDIACFRSWGMKLVKIDYITFDWMFTWGHKLRETPMAARYVGWRDDSRTAAEVVRDLYVAMREAAGDDMIIIGCNALDHFAAGLFELQRTGDDTSGCDWSRTCSYGVNTMGARMHHDRTFYAVDGDCVGLTELGKVPWEKNRMWLDLLANSGTTLFVSWRRQCMNDEVRAALTEACRKASGVQPSAEPLDWMENLCPSRWRFGQQEKLYKW